MKQGIIVALAVVLLGAQCICLCAATVWADKRMIVALQDSLKVELYITSWCPYSKKAVSFFQSRGIPFVSYDIEKDESAARRKSQLDSKSGVPFAIINGQKIHGYSEEDCQIAINPK